MQLQNSQMRQSFSRGFEGKRTHMHTRAHTRAHLSSKRFSTRYVNRPLRKPSSVRVTLSALIAPPAAEHLGSDCNVSVMRTNITMVFDRHSCKNKTTGNKRSLAERLTQICSDRWMRMRAVDVDWLSVFLQFLI